MLKTCYQMALYTEKMYIHMHTQKTESDTCKITVISELYNFLNFIVLFMCILNFKQEVALLM